MLIVKWFVVVVLLLIVVAVAAGQLGFLQGTAPTDLGVNRRRIEAVRAKLDPPK